MPCLIVGMFICFAIWTSLILISQHRYYPAIGWCIITAVFIFMLIWSLIKPGDKLHSGESFHKKFNNISIIDKEKLLLLYASNDIIRIAQVEQALQVHGIDCSVMDRHGSVMMSFIPEIEMRIMVTQEDYEFR